MSTVTEPILPRDDVVTARHHPLLILLLAAAAGIVLDRYLPHGFAVWWMAAAASWLLWLVCWRWPGSRFAWPFLLLTTASLFAAWHHAQWNLFPPDELSRAATYDSQPVCLEAVALSNVRWLPAGVDDPLNVIPQGDRSRLLVQLLQARHRTHWQAVSGYAQLTIEGHLLGIQAGDRVRLTVLMQRVPPAQNPGEFDAALYQRVGRQLVRLNAPSPDCIERLQVGSYFDWRRRIEALRQDANEVLWRNISPEHAGLAAGLLVGSREQIDEETTQGFFLTGTIHLLAISGVHVGILVYGFWFVMRTGLMSRRGAILSAIAFVLLYTLLTNAEPPVVRSAILIIFVCVGRWIGRPFSAINALAAGGLVVLAMNPAQLFQVGAQLSFLAVATLIYCGPWLVPKLPGDPLDRFLYEHRPFWWRWGRWLGSFAWRLWLTSVCVWLVALPLTLYHFHVVSPSALWLNPLVWLPVSLALYFGFATLTLGWLVPLLGPWLGGACDFCLGLIDWCVALGERSPGSHYWLPGPALWWVVVCYLGLGLYVGLGRYRPRWYWGVSLLMVWIAIGYVAAERSPWKTLVRSEPKIVATFVAVGHGTSVLLEMPDGRTLLYDAGHMGSPGGAADAISAVLWSRGLDRLDAVMISHADADHYNALPELLERFGVGVVYVSPMMFAGDLSQSMQALQDAIAEHEVPLVVVHAGQRLTLGNEVVGELLHPPKKGFFGSDNASSLVLSLNLGERRLLLPGDLESPGMDDLLAEEPLPCDVVMTPHHGSARSNPLGFAEWSTPPWVLISGSRARDATEVVDAYRSFGAEVLHTGHDGAVQFQLSSSGTQVQSWDGQRWQPRGHHGLRDGVP